MVMSLTKGVNGLGMLIILSRSQKQGKQIGEDSLTN
jgi:hypothetical protein